LGGKEKEKERGPGSGFSFSFLLLREQQKETKKNEKTFFFFLTKSSHRFIPGVLPFPSSLLDLEMPPAQSACLTAAEVHEGSAVTR